MLGFQEEGVHQELVRYLEEYLEGFLAAPLLGWEASLGAIWQGGKRLVLSYNYQGLDRLQSEYRWPWVVHKWGNVQSVSSLRRYLVPVVARKYIYPWSVMAELTPTGWDVATGRLGSLRQMAHLTNHNVTEWFQGDWGASCNIISVDFLRSSGIVRAAISWNLRRARRSLCGI